MKKVLLQLDTDEHPSPFDAIVAHDAGVDVLLSHSGVKAESARALAQDAFFTRGPDDLNTMAVWVGGKNVAAGEEIFDEVQKAFFGPFRVSVMIDSNGCNTTAATTIARIAKERSLVRRPRGRDRRWEPSACGRPCCSQKEGCEVTVAALPPDLFGDDRPTRRPRGLAVAKKLGLDVREPADRGRARGGCSTGAQIVLVGRARRRAGAAARLLGASTRRSSCWPTTTRRSRWASRARRRPTTWPTTTASSCSARWRSAARR